MDLCALLVNSVRESIIQPSFFLELTRSLKGQIRWYIWNPYGVKLTSIVTHAGTVPISDI